MDVHAEPARAGRGEAGEVGLHRARDEHGVGAPPLRLAEVELELAHLVASQDEARAIVALDPKLDTQGGAEIRGRLERGRHMAESDSRKRFDTGQGMGHDADAAPRGRTNARDDTQGGKSVRLGSQQALHVGWYPFGRWIPAFAGMTETMRHGKFHSSRNPPAGSIPEKQVRTSTSVYFLRNSPCTNTNAP